MSRNGPAAVSAACRATCPISATRHAARAPRAGAPRPSAATSGLEDPSTAPPAGESAPPKLVEAHARERRPTGGPAQSRLVHGWRARARRCCRMSAYRYGLALASTTSTSSSTPRKPTFMASAPKRFGRQSIGLRSTSTTRAARADARASPSSSVPAAAYPACCSAVWAGT